MSHDRQPLRVPDVLPIPVVDNHCHLDLSRDDHPPAPVADALAAAAAVGVDRVVQIGCDLASAEWTTQMVDVHPAMLGGVAIHPNGAPELLRAGALDDACVQIERYAAHPRIRVIGETGLDYFRTSTDGHVAQQESFRRHIEIAKRTGTALQIHDRDAHADVLRILAEEGAPDRTVLHCFSGDMAMARECVRRGYFLSFAGPVTFKNARELRNVLAVVPTEYLLVETDSPYLTPSPYRGASNSPSLMPLTIRVMADTLSCAVPVLCQAVSANSGTVYGRW